MQNTYDFCPKCGAIVRNGVCTSCGAVYGNPEEMKETVEESLENASGAFEEEALEHPEIDGRTAEEPFSGEQNPEGKEQYGSYNYYGGQSPAGYSERKKKKNTGIVIGVMAAAFLIVVILVVYIGHELSRLSKGNFMADVKKSIEEALAGNEKEDEYPMDGEADEDYWNEYEKEQEGQSLQYDKNFKEERKNYDASQITGPYYEEFVNCIDESVSYQVNREFYEKIDEEQGVCIQVSYIQLEGNIPNLETINEKIEEESMLLANVYLEEEDYYQNIFNEYDYMTTYIKVESFVTVNDEESISIALDERYDLGGFASILKMQGININLKTGTVLDNTEILNTDEEFVKDFVRRSNGQNGKNSVAIDGISDREKLQLFQDADSLILFYTPIGLEVGYNYSGVEGYTGWITVSIEEYEQYLKGY